MAHQGVETHWSRIGGVEHDYVAMTRLRDVRQYVVHQIAFGLDHHDAASGSYVLLDQSPE